MIKMTVDRQHQHPVFVYLRFDYDNNSMIDNDSKKKQQKQQQVIIQSMKEYLDRKYFQLLEQHKEQTKKMLLKAKSMLNNKKNSDEGSAVATMKNIQDDDNDGNNSKNKSSLSSSSSSSSSVLNKTTQRKQYSHTFLPIHETQKEEATSARESSTTTPAAAFSDSDVAKTTTEAAKTTTNNNIVVFVVDITRLTILSDAYDDDDDYYSIHCFDRRPYYYNNKKSCIICKEYDIEWWDRPLWLWKWYERVYACGALLIYDMIHSIQATSSTKTNNSTVTKFIISNNNNSTKWGNDDEQLWKGDWMFRLLINNVEGPHNNNSSSSSMVQHDQSDFDEKYIEYSPHETSTIDQEFFSSEIDQEEEEEDEDDDDTTFSSRMDDEKDSTIEKHYVLMLDNQMSQNKNEYKKESNTNVQARPESGQAGGGNDLNPDLIDEIDDWNLQQDAVSNNCHNISEERIDIVIDTVDADIDSTMIQSTPTSSKDLQKTEEQSNGNHNNAKHDEATTTEAEAEAASTTSKPKQHQNEKTTSIPLLENHCTRVYGKFPTEVEEEEEGEETRNDGGSINNIHETNFDDGDNSNNTEFGISSNESGFQQDTISSPTDDINNNSSLEVEEYDDEGGGQLPTTTTNIVSRECTPSKDDFDDEDCDCSQNGDIEQHGNEDIMIDYNDLTQHVTGIVVETTNTKKKNNKEPQIDSRGVDYTVLSEVPVHFRSEARLALAVGQHDSNKRKQLHSSAPPPSADPRLRQWLSTYSSSNQQCSSRTGTSDLPTTGTSSKKKIKREIADFFS